MDTQLFKKDILKNVLLVTVFLFFAKVIGFLKDVVFAWKLGISPFVDFYSLLNQLLNLPISFVFNVLTLVLVPALNLSAFTKKEQDSFIAGIYGILLLFSVLFSVLFLCYFLFVLDRTVSSDTISKNLFLLSIFLFVICIPIGIFSYALAAISLSKNNQSVTLLEAWPSFTVLVACLVITANLETWILFATTFGYMFFIFSLGMQKSLNNYFLVPTLSFYSPLWSKTKTDFIYVCLAYVILGISNGFDFYLAEKLAEGRLSILNYSVKIVSIGLSIGTLVIGRSILPILSKISAKKTVALSNLVFRWSVVVFLASTVGVLFLNHFMHGFVSLIFERGAFTGNNTRDVAIVSQILILQTPFFMTMLIFWIFFCSRRNYLILVLSVILGSTVKISFLFGFSEHLTLNNIAYSSVIFYAVISTALFLYFYFHPESLRNENNF